MVFPVLFRFVQRIVISVVIVLQSFTIAHPADRMSLLLLLVCCMDGKFVAENPRSSLVFSYETFLQAVRLLKRAFLKARVGLTSWGRL